MLKRLDGIITRKIKYGETSLIVDLLTSEYGLRSYIVSGVRKKSKRATSSVYQVLNIVQAVVYDKDSDKLSRIKELSYGYVYKSIPFDVIKSAIATFLIEVSRKSGKVSDDPRALFNFIVKGLIHLDNMQEGLSHFHIEFLINLSSILGFGINNNYSSERTFFNYQNGRFESHRVDHRNTMSSEDSAVLHHYLTGKNFDQINKVSRKRIIHRMLDYYKFHIEGFGDLKSLDVLTTLFE